MLGKYNSGATLAVKDMETATAFYGGKLGLKVLTENQERQDMMYGSGDSTLIVYVSQYAGTNKATAAFWSVDDVETEVAELREKGVEFEHYPDLPGVKLEGDVHSTEGTDDKAAWFKDPDGNILCIFSAQ